MQETPPSNLKIYFGLGGDDSTFEVKNIVINFSDMDRIRLNGRSKWSAEGYKQVKAFYDCKGLHIVGRGSNEDGETFFPTTSIFNVVVDWLEGHEEDKA